MSTVLAALNQLLVNVLLCRKKISDVVEDRFLAYQLNISLNFS